MEFILCPSFLRFGWADGGFYYILLNCIVVLTWVMSPPGGGNRRLIGADTAPHKALMQEFPRPAGDAPRSGIRREAQLAVRVAATSRNCNDSKENASKLRRFVESAHSMQTPPTF